MTTAILFILLFTFMLLGMPIAIALGLSSVLTNTSHRPATAQPTCRAS